MASFLVDDYMMADGLRLTGCELLVFAVIFSYSRNNQKLFASEGSLAKRLGYSRKQVDRSLAWLRKVGLVLRSEKKHEGRQSYDYSVNMEKVGQIVPALLDKMSQQGEIKSPSEVEQSVPVGRYKMSHNNKSNNSSDNGVDRSLLSPFSYFILNREWGKLLRQPKWVEKSKESLQIALRKLMREPPVICFYMMDYTIERSYDRIFAANEEVKKQAGATASAFFAKETQERTELVNKMLSQLGKISRNGIQMPPKDNFQITPNGASITCSAEFHDWVENNSETFPIIKSWTLNLQLTYNIPK